MFIGDFHTLKAHPSITFAIVLDIQNWGLVTRNSIVLLCSHLASQLNLNFISSFVAKLG